MEEQSTCQLVNAPPSKFGWLVDGTTSSDYPSRKRSKSFRIISNNADEKNKY